MAAAMMAAAFVITADPNAAARADYKLQSAADKPYVRYLVAPALPAFDQPRPPLEQAVAWHEAISFGVCHSTQAVDLGAARPVVVAPGCLRIDLRALGWQYADWLEVLKPYPYNAKQNPLTVRGDWLLLQLADSATSNAYLRLQFGDPAKLSRDELLRRMLVDRKQAQVLKLEHGLIEKQSQVAVNRTRVLEFLPRLGGYASGTRDWLELRAENSPLEFPDLKGLKHDGEEWIIGLPKYWPGGRGTLQSYFLSDGAGKLVAEAPVRLVEDGSRFRAITSIRYPGSCFGCHREGLNKPTENGLQSWIADGIELKAKTKEAAAFLERWHLTGTSTTIARANEDCAKATEYACFGMPQARALANWQAAIAWHDRQLTIEQCAAELGTTAAALRESLAITSDKTPIGGYLAALAHGRPIRRDIWESLYLTAQAILDNDTAKKGKP